MDNTTKLPFLDPDEGHVCRADVVILRQVAARDEINSNLLCSVAKNIEFTLISMSEPTIQSECEHDPIPYAVWTDDKLPPFGDSVLIGNVFVCSRCLRYKGMKIDSSADVSKKIAERTSSEPTSQASGEMLLRCAELCEKGGGAYYAEDVAEVLRDLAKGKMPMLWSDVK